MAETKAPAKKAAPKKELSLTEQLAAKRADLLELKNSNAAGELVNPRAITAMRKDIPRLMTKVNAEKEKK